MPSGIGQQLKACGRNNIPVQIRICDRKYRLVQTFKHDFFAATALYEEIEYKKSDNQKKACRVVLKLARQGDFLGLPLGWLGEAICQHEYKILHRLSGVRGTPRLLGRFGKTGLVYEFIEGKSLDQGVEVPDEFFDQLEELLSDIHTHHIAYIDINKRGNIILGSDNQAYLIDYQISIFVDAAWRKFFRPARFILKTLQKEDVYHLYKHKRRFRSDLMDEDQLRQSRRISRWVALHRTLTRPLTRIRRRFLSFLYQKNQLVLDETITQSAESDPTRWHKKNRKST